MILRLKTNGIFKFKNSKYCEIWCPTPVSGPLTRINLDWPFNSFTTKNSAGRRVSLTSISLFLKKKFVYGLSLSYYEGLREEKKILTKIRNILCIPQSFNTNILHQLFYCKITFVNSQPENTNSNIDFVLKTRFKRLF